MDALGNILVIDDDPDLLDTVEFLLSEAGYQVTTVLDGQQAIPIFDQHDFDLVIVDLMLPGTDGLTLTRALKAKSDVGIIILSGHGEATDKIVGLEVGADDYVAKPFDTRELLARVRSVLRRSGKKSGDVPTQSQVYAFEGWKLDVSRRKLTSPKGDLVELTSGEFNLLRAFVENPGSVLSRDQLLDHTHPGYTPAFDRSIDVQLGRLRKKIEDDPKKQRFIKTIRNAGYIFTAKVSSS